MKSVSSQSDVANQRDHFALFAIMFALSLSFKIIESTKFIDGAINLTFHTFAILVAAAMVIAKPRSTSTFLLMCLFYAFYASAKHPFGSNSMMMQAAIALITLTAAAVLMIRSRTLAIDSAD